MQFEIGRNGKGTSLKQLERNSGSHAKPKVGITCTNSSIRMSPVGAYLIDRLWDIGCYEIDRRMGGTGMRLVLTIIASLVLAGCAGTYDKLADANLCEPSMPA